MSLKSDLAAYSVLIPEALDAKLSATDDSYFNKAFGVQLTKDSLLVWLNEPSQLTLNLDLKNKIESIIGPLLFPTFTVINRPGLNLIARVGQPVESARALVFRLHYGTYKRLLISNILTETNVYQDENNFAIQLMHGFFWRPYKYNHLALQAMTRAGKTTLLAYLLVNCLGVSRMTVKTGAIDDGVNALIVIDPKMDPFLRQVSFALKAEYIVPNFSKSDMIFVDSVNKTLQNVLDTVHTRAIRLKSNPHASFKDLWVVIDEGLAIPNMASTKARTTYFSLLDRLLLTAASVQVHVILSGQSFGVNQICTSYARQQFSIRILLTPKVTVENAEYLFKELDVQAINSLITPEDQFGDLACGICSCGGNIIPFKAPFVGGLNK